MAQSPRLRGQEIRVAIIDDGTTNNNVNSIGSFNENVDGEIQEDGFLGEIVNRFDDILNGFGGDMEFQLTTANWVLLQNRIIERMTRQVPGRVFNVVRTDQFANGESAVFVYKDVKWGAMPTAVPTRKDFVKVKASFKCSERSQQINAFI